MGDPIRLKKKYDTPQHPWEGKRIEEENILKEEYGLKNKKELWKVNTLLRKIKQQARKLIVAESEQAKKEEKQLIEKLIDLNLITKGAAIDEILGVDIKKLLDQRLQTQVFKKGLSKTIKQARQFIVHKHILVNNSIVNKPSYLIRKDEETKINFSGVSNLSKPDHPEREIGKKEKKVKPLKFMKKTKKSNLGRRKNDRQRS